MTAWSFRCPPRRAPPERCKYSPNLDAVPRLFLLGDTPEKRSIADADRPRIRREPGPGQTVCPYSGYIGDDEAFIHADDIEAVKKYILWMAANDVSNWLGDWAKDFNRRQPRGGFITIVNEGSKLTRYQRLKVPHLV